MTDPQLVKSLTDIGIVFEGQSLAPAAPVTPVEPTTPVAGDTTAPVTPGSSEPPVTPATPQGQDAQGATEPPITPVETPPSTDTPPTDDGEKITITKKEMEAFQSHKKAFDLLEVVKNDVPGFLRQINERIEKLKPPRPKVEDRIAELRKKFPDDFVFQPQEAINNPLSDSAKFEIERMKILQDDARLAVEEERTKTVAVERWASEKLRYAETANAAIDIESKRYGVPPEGIAAFQKLVASVENDPGLLIAEFYKNWAKANYGLTTTASRLKLEEEEAVKAKEKAAALSAGTGSKLQPPPKQDENSVFNQTMKNFEV